MKHKNFDGLYPYTYIVITPDNKKYYGVRYGNLKLENTPEEDLGIKYFSSSKCIKRDFKKNTKDYKFRIHYTFDSIEEAIEYEHKFLTKVYRNKDWLNKTNNKSFDESKFERRYDRQEAALKSADTMRNDVVDGENMLIRKAKKSLDTLIRTGALHKRAKKAHITKSIIGGDNLTTYQRTYKLSLGKFNEEERKSNAKAANDKFEIRLKNMSEDEFENYLENCSSDSRRRASITIRNKP